MHLLNGTMHLNANYPNTKSDNIKPNQSDIQNTECTRVLWFFYFFPSPFEESAYPERIADEYHRKKENENDLQLEGMHKMVLLRRRLLPHLGNLGGGELWNYALDHPGARTGRHRRCDGKL